MKNEIKYALYLIALGFSLVAYAHLNFATKDSVSEMKQDIREIRVFLLGEK
jgi:bacteriorhodopsin